MRIIGGAAGAAGAALGLSTIKVTPEELSAKAEDVLSKTALAERAFADMQSTVKRSASYWQGEAAECHRKLFEEQVPTMEEILARFREHSQDLSAMASNYLAGEEKAKSLSQSLAADIVE